MIRARLRIRDVGRWLGFAFAAVLFARLLFGAEGRGALSVLRNSGPVLLLALVPFLAFEAIDAAAWRRLMLPLGHSPRLASLFRTRLSVEAVNLTVPAGTAVCEALTPPLLESTCGIPIGDGIVALAARRWTVLRAHAVYLALGASAAFLGVAERHPLLPWLTILFAGFELGIAEGARRLFTEHRGSTRLESLLRRLPGRLRRYFEVRRTAFAAVDRRFGVFARAEEEQWVTNTAIYLAAWMVETCETFLLLRLVGAPVPFATVFPVEAALSFVRSAAFIAPAGLGVQDVGYVALLQGVPAPAVLAFVALKRAKELFWAGAGYLLLLGRTSESGSIARDASG